MGRSVLITGGAGFVGSHLCRTLVTAGDSVVVVDNLFNGLRENVPAGVEFLPVDIADDAFLERLAQRRFDAVLHCAAQSSNAISFRDPRLDLMANQYGTLNVLKLCRALGVRRLLYTSSMSIYGQAQHLPTPESEPARPQSFYGVHKYAGEEYIRVLAEQYGVQYTVFRLYTTYGPGQNLANRDQGLVSIYLSYILRGEPLLVKGSKDRRRDIVYVDDVVEALTRALDSPITYGKTYNLGSGRAHTIEEIVGFLLREMGHRDGYAVLYDAPTAGDPDATLADIRRIQADLGWQPRVFAEEGIRLTVQSYRRTVSKGP